MTVYEIQEAKSINTENTIIYLIFFLSMILIIGFIYLSFNKKKKQWYEYASPGKGKIIDKIYGKIYKFIKDFPLTRNYVHKLSYRYRLISPCDSKTIARKSVNVFIITAIISIFSYIIVYARNKNLMTLIRVVFITFISNAEVVGRIAKYHEINMLDEIEKMISEVIHFYYVEYRIDDAIYRAKENLSKDMKVVADQIYQILISDDKGIALREYYENIPNKYLRAFVSQCVSIIEKGDQEINGKFLFVKNMENLQREINIEREKLQRLNIEFYGVIICVIAPIFFIDIVKEFSIYLKEEMRNFYYGKEGYLLEIGLLTIITFIYIIMRKNAEYKTFYQSNHRWLYILDKGPIKKALDNYCFKYAGRIEKLKIELRNIGNNIKPRHFILRNIIFSGVAFILSVLISVYLIQVNKNNLVNVDKSEIETITSAENEVQAEKIAQIISDYTKRYVKNKEIIKEERLKENIKKDSGFYNERLLNVIVTEIKERTDKYNNQVFNFINLFICFCISLITYFIPELLMKYNSVVSKDAMEDEVNQFNAVINMLMYKDGMTVRQILEEIESFAVIFKKSLQKCINELSLGEINALYELKENEPYEPFRRIVDNLIRCDDMPISKAFEEINLDHEGYLSKRKIENEKSIKKRIFRSYLLAVIPFFLLFLYGIIPVVFKTVQEMNTLLSELQNMMW